MDKLRAIAAAMLWLAGAATERVAFVFAAWAYKRAGEIDASFYGKEEKQ